MKISRVVANVWVIAALICCLGQARELGGNDERVLEEVSKAKQILASLEADNFLTSPYLVSAIYYHDHFLGDTPASLEAGDPDRRIIGQISNMLTVDLKMRFVRLLHERWAESKPLGSAQFVKPVSSGGASGGRHSHHYAIDLFAREGTAVHSVSRGVVMLADGGWSVDDVFSTTSRKGGNAVIVFDPDKNHFYRYCHLRDVAVSVGQILTTGQQIGRVGHTGLNASRPGHGQHLHFETNEFVGGHVRAMDYRRLRAMLRQWGPA